LNTGVLQIATLVPIRPASLHRPEKRLAGRTKPEGDRLRAWIRMADHPIPKITGPAQPGFHLGGGVGTPLRCLNRGENCFTRCFHGFVLLQRLNQGIEGVQHRAVTWLGATQFADGPASLS
jgi:hypothetical protein